MIQPTQRVSKAFRSELRCLRPRVEWVASPYRRRYATPAMAHDYSNTRQSWNNATRNHNSHKGDQAAFLREGGSTLFPEELALLGDLAGKSVVHLQCNSGQDSLCLARAAASVTGVDLSDEAVGFARGLSRDSGIEAEFVEAEVVTWLEETDRRFDIVFASYGVCGWLPDIDAWARGIRRVLVPGGRFVYVDFHPLVWSWDESIQPKGDDYFSEERFSEQVTDYVAQSREGLGLTELGPTEVNRVAAHSYQYGLAKTLQALIGAGLTLDTVHEYPHSNGFKPHDFFVPLDGRRWGWPEGTARTPLMFGLAVRRPD